MISSVVVSPRERRSEHGSGAPDPDGGGGAPRGGRGHVIIILNYNYNYVERFMRDDIDREIVEMHLL